VSRQSGATSLHTIAAGLNAQRIQQRQAISQLSRNCGADCSAEKVFCAPSPLSRLSKVSFQKGTPPASAKCLKFYIANS
jgi:hypothetical protein